MKFSEKAQADNFEQSVKASKLLLTRSGQIERLLNATMYLIGIGSADAKTEDELVEIGQARSLVSSISECFATVGQMTMRDAIKKFISYNTHTSKGEPLFANTFDQFLNASRTYLSCVAERGFVGLESLEPIYPTLATEAHKCNKLATYSNDPSGNRLTVDAVTATFDVICHWRALELMETPGKELEMLDSHKDYLGVIQKLHKETVSDKDLKQGVVNVFAGQDSNVADKVSAYLDKFKAAARSHASRIVEVVNARLEPQRIELENFKDHLNMTSAVQFVTNVKKRVEAIAIDLDLCRKYLVGCNIEPAVIDSLTRVSGLKKEICITATHWGIRSVVNRPDIADPVKGARSRSVLKGLRDTYLMDSEYAMDEPTMLRITALLEIVDVAPDGQPAKKKARNA